MKLLRIFAAVFMFAGILAGCLALLLLVLLLGALSAPADRRTAGVLDFLPPREGVGIRNSSGRFHHCPPEIITTHRAARQALAASTQ